MKKLVLLLFAMVCAINVNAQTYDETELLGKWDVTSMTGQVNNFVISFESLYLGDTLLTGDEFGWALVPGYLTNVKIYEDGESYNPQNTFTYEVYPFDDFFISNNNKLHICNPESSNQIRLVIKEWANDVMKLESYDGKTKIELRKDKSAVKSVNAETPRDEAIYNIQGHKVKHIEKGNIYINNNRKFIAR